MTYQCVEEAIKLFCLALELKVTTKHELFVHFSPHISAVILELHLGGWKDWRERKTENRVNIYYWLKEDTFETFETNNKRHKGSPLQYIKDKIAEYDNKSKQEVIRG